ncbi:MAG: HAMP domain-containing sensor histidine kinase [Eubacteriales bacterium]|nr:HAMP domain-containing sensor histidine kinase [Eubacteriales bacterium]
MEIGWICAVVALALAAAILLLKWALLRASLREVSRELAEKLRTDTNTLISLSSGDRAVRALAAQMNIQLQALRRERLRLQKGDAELKNAITNVSHDLRTPLTAICGYLELLEKEEHSEKARRYLAVIRERSQAMRDLTEELFRYSMAAAAAEEMTRQPVSVKDVLEQSLAGFYGSLTEKGISPEIRLPNGPVVRNLDPAALRRIFDNLLNNALKYSDGDLRVSLTEAGEAVFSNAAGKLDCVQTQRLFDRFYTVETASGSTGLGLSIAHMLVEKMGGEIGAEYVSGRLRIFVRFPEAAR